MAIQTYMVGFFSHFFQRVSQRVVHELFLVTRQTQNVRIEEAHRLFYKYVL